MRSHKTRGTRDRSISHSLQRWVSTKSSISQLTFFYFIIMFKVNNSTSQQELLLSCCFFDHVSSIVNKLWLLLCYLRVPFHQLASSPGFHVTHIPKGNLVICRIINMHIYICPRAMDPFCDFDYSTATTTKRNKNKREEERRYRSPRFHVRRTCRNTSITICCCCARVAHTAPHIAVQSQRPVRQNRGSSRAASFARWRNRPIYRVLRYNRGTAVAIVALFGQSLYLWVMRGFSTEDLPPRHQPLYVSHCMTTVECRPLYIDHCMSTIVC